MGDRKKYTYNNARLQDFTNTFREIVNEAGGVSKVSEMTGISRPTITFWYNGERTPDAKSLITLADTFHLSIDTLLGRPVTQSEEQNIAIAKSITGLSAAAIKTLRDLHNAHLDGLAIKGYAVSHIDLLSELLETGNEFYRLFDEIALYMVYGGALPEQAYKTQENELRLDEWERFHRWANGHNREIIQREDARELHLQLAGEKLKTMCRDILKKTLEEKAKKEGSNDGKH